MAMAEVGAASASSGAGQSLGMFAGAAAGTAAIGGFSLAAFIVMALTEPRSQKEWAVALISTLMGSFGGGAWAMIYFELYLHLDPGNKLLLFLGCLEIIGVAFIAGLPGWLLVRLAFNTMESWKNKTAKEVAADVKEML